MVGRANDLFYLNLSLLGLSFSSLSILNNQDPNILLYLFDSFDSPVTLPELADTRMEKRHNSGTVPYLCGIDCMLGLLRYKF